MKDYFQHILIVLSLFVIWVGRVADFLQVISEQYGLWLLGGLLVSAISYYAVGKPVWNLWNSYRKYGDTLEQIGQLLQNHGRQEVVRKCFVALRIFQQQDQTIRIITIQSPDTVIVDTSNVPLSYDDDLLGLEFSITSLNGGGQTKGTVVLCNRDSAHIRLDQPPTITPQVNDLATPIQPTDATELECLIAKAMLVLKN
ncbi:hypothetical protein QUF58_09650 [Anaerolineales bacterium HSG24]|nr:hypothetical protein [Anaerolineales bacterium HSG24]